MRTRTRMALAATVSLALSALAAPPAGAAVSVAPPRITHFAIRGQRPTEEGGLIALKFSVKSATECQLLGPQSVIGGEWSGHCSAHHGIHRIWVPANTSATARRYRLTLIAMSHAGIVRRHLTVVVPGEPTLRTGLWMMTIQDLSSKGLPETLPIEFRPGGVVNFVQGKATYTGTWTYKHHELTFSLYFEGLPETFSAVGSARGPLSRSSEIVTLGGKPLAEISIFLVHT